MKCINIVIGGPILLVSVVFIIPIEYLHKWDNFAFRDKFLYCYAIYANVPLGLYSCWYFIISYIIILLWYSNIKWNMFNNEYHSILSSAFTSSHKRIWIVIQILLWMDPSIYVVFSFSHYFQFYYFFPYFFLSIFPFILIWFGSLVTHDTIKSPNKIISHIKAIFIDQNHI